MMQKRYMISALITLGSSLYAMDIASNRQDIVQTLTNKIDASDSGNFNELLKSVNNSKRKQVITDLLERSSQVSTKLETALGINLVCGHGSIYGAGAPFLPLPYFITDSNLPASGACLLISCVSFGIIYYTHKQETAIRSKLQAQTELKELLRGEYNK